MTLSSETFTSAGQFGDVCEFATLNLRPLVGDQILRGLPRFLGRWEDGTTLPLMLDYNWEIATSGDDCTPSVASSEILECTIVMPNQRKVSIGTSGTIQYRDMMQKFCEARRITNFPTLFRPDGSFDEGAPLADVFLDYLVSDLKSAFMKHLREIAWTGSQSTRHQFEGILTQLDAGPLSNGDGCELYNIVSFDWNALVEGSGVGHPSGTIAAAQDTQTIHGKTFSGLTGLNVVEMMVLWLERLFENELERWADDQIEFELWVPKGQTVCITQLAACLQPCDGCVNPMSDPNIRDRASQFRRDKVIWLYPYDNVSITIKTSTELDDRMILVPKMIAGRPTIAWVFRDQQEEQDILNGVLPWYGQQPGVPMNTPLFQDDGFDENSLFEQRAFSLSVSRDHDCLDVYMSADVGMLLFAWNAWLQFTNINCEATLTDGEYIHDMSQAITDCAAIDGDTLDYTVAALESQPHAPAAGDTYAVYFTDGVTQLIGTVVSYDTGTDALRLDFAVAVTCGTGGGAISVAFLADNT